jgi:signal transduction histidine kinase
MKEMRLLLYDLRPLTLQQDGLEGALHRRLEAVEGKLNVKTELRVDRYLRLDSRMEQELYHIAQESLNNILKYSEASKVSVSLKAQNGCVELEISDNGIGFELPAIEHTHGIGLASMRERTEKMGGSFHISSMPGQGTCVRVRVPADDHVPLLLHVDT